MADEESVVDWYRRRTWQHKHRKILRLICNSMQAGLVELHAWKPINLQR